MGFNVYGDSDMFPYLDGYMVGDKRATVTIAKVTREGFTDFDSGEVKEKTVLYFVDRDKGMVLNKTNTRALVRAIGSPNTDDWLGASMTVWAEKERKVFKNLVRPLRLDDIRRAAPAAKSQKVAATKPAAKPAAPQTNAVADANNSLFGDEPGAPPVHPDF